MVVIVCAIMNGDLSLYRGNHSGIQCYCTSKRLQNAAISFDSGDRLDVILFSFRTISTILDGLVITCRSGIAIEISARLKSLQ